MTIGGERGVSREALKDEGLVSPAPHDAIITRARELLRHRSSGPDSQRGRDEALVDPEKLDRFMSLIDAQGVENYHPHHTGMGADFPITSVDLNKLATDYLGQSKVGERSSQPPAPNEKEVLDYVLFSGYLPPPDGHPFTTWDMTYDRIFRLLGKVKNGASVRVHIVGYPWAIGGTTSQEWQKHVHDEGFDAYGRALAPYLKTLLEEKPGSRVVLQANSFGALVSDAIQARLLEVYKRDPSQEDPRTKIKVLLDTPADNATIARGIRFSTLFLAEFAALFANPKTRDFVVAMAQDSRAFNIFLKKHTSDSQEVTNSIVDTKWDLWHMIKGRVLKAPDEFRTFIRRSWKF
ncbi:MAG: hypothetical protein UZ21_OP11001000683 [Microgenomates bacterium OLB22]|nr:MAG: hypothetical protein UZ21_OP11001000683 [Microgenomates bacterium OLB22]